MDYTSIFDPIPWKGVFHSVIQATTLYWLLLFGMRAVGRRIFGQMGPQDMIILLLIAESCDLGLSDETSGYWGTFFSVITILVNGAMADKVPFLRHLLEEKPSALFENGRLNQKNMAKFNIEESELDQIAREYGLSDYRGFERMIMESDGSITGVLRNMRQNKGQKPGKHESSASVTSS